MKIPNIKLLVVLMSAVLIGIIFVQYKWITEAIKVKDEQFNNLVTRSLYDISKKIQMKRDLYYLQCETLPGGFINIPQIDSSLFNFHDIPEPLLPVMSPDINLSITRSDSLNEIDLICDFDKEDEKEKILRISDSTDRVVIHDDTILIKKVNRGKNNEWEKAIIQYKNMVERMIIENRHIHSEKYFEPDTQYIREFIKYELKKAGINHNFDIALQHIQNEKKHEKWVDTTFQRRKVYVIDPFHADLLNKNDLLYISFPENKPFIPSQLAWLFAASGIFTLTLMAMFGLSLVIIIRQKKFAEMQADFINNMTHEFKTPIATIALASDTAANPANLNNETEIYKYLGIIRYENKRMLSIVEKILELAAFENQELQIHTEKTNLNILLKDIAERFSFPASEKQGVINLNLPDKPVFIQADPLHLSNAISNIIDNAIKYGNPPVIAVIKLHETGNSAVISVSDNGPGIAHSHQKNLFKRFYRVSSGNVHNVKGFGLGLYYTRLIAEKHGGKITVESSPGKGARFDIYLPKKDEN